MFRLLSKNLAFTTAILLAPMMGPSFAQASQSASETFSSSTMTAMKNQTAINAPYNDFLAKYVSEKDGINLVAYADVSNEDEQILEDYIEVLSNTDISDYNDDEIMAYWFNLYNAKTIDVILDNYPLKSIRKIGFVGPWKKKLLTVNGEAMSLDDIEHGTIRATYDEPRIHFAFNCASIGCPNLKMTAWEAATLEADLTQASIDFINSPRGVSVSDNGKLTGSSLFKWYKKDFGETSQEVVDYLSQFAKGDIKAAMEGASKFDKFEYDWDLNEAK